MPDPSLFPYLMNPLGGSGGDTINVVELFDIELQAAPDVDVAQPVDVELDANSPDVDVAEPVDVEVPS